MKRDEPITVGQALKLIHLTHGQVLEQAYRDTELQIRAMDAEREALEEQRSVRRNRNRLMVLIVALVISSMWPMFAMHVLHSSFGLAWTTALSNSGDIGITTYALKRRY